MKKTLLVPEPRKFCLLGGVSTLREHLRIHMPSECPRPVAIALGQLTSTLDALTIHTSMAVEECNAEQDTSVLLLGLTEKQPAEGYRLHIGDSAIRLIGHDIPGLFYGLHTLVQLIRCHGRHLPRCRIDDNPTFPHRAMYLDVTRGKVPQLKTLKALVDRFSALKINQLQLYVEHVFAFQFDKDIWSGCDPITAREIKALDAYCADRCIELIPSLACFGHMGRILSIPQYRALAEIEWKAPAWKEAAWRQRLRGATINPLDPAARRLLRKMMDEFLPLFRSSSFNVCADETYDLGRGKSAKKAERYGIARLYLDHIAFLRKEARTHGKDVMFWGDVMLQHKEKIPDIPSDCTVLDWGYSSKTRFKKCRDFTRCGLDTYVCPSTRGYQVVFNLVEEARGNISGYATEGAKAGAVGLMTTDWGDIGHFNMRTCSLHGMALGAAVSWNPKADSHRTFDRAFALQLLGSTSSTAARLFPLAGSTAVASWPFLLAPFPSVGVKVPTRRSAGSVPKRIVPALGALSDIGRGEMLADYEVDELTLGCRALLLNADKAMLVREHMQPREWSKQQLTSRRKEFAENLTSFVDDYRSVWMVGNKRSQVDEIVRALQQVAEQVRTG